MHWSVHLKPFLLSIHDKIKSADLELEYGGKNEGGGILTFRKVWVRRAKLKKYLAFVFGALILSVNSPKNFSEKGSAMGAALTNYGWSIFYAYIV